MALKKLTLASLALLHGGRIAAALDQEIKRAVADCRDRPGVVKPRKVSLLFEVQPEQVDDSTSDVETVTLAFELKNSFPGRRARSCSMKVQKNGDLLFNEDAPDNADQSTLFDALPDPETNKEE